MTEPRREERHAFSLPKLGGRDHARDLVTAYGGVDLVARNFQISPSLVKRYISGQSDPPFTFLCALWWQTSRGFNQAFAECHWTHQYNSFRRLEAEERARSLELVLGHAIALLEHRADAAQMVRDSLAAINSAQVGRIPPGLPVIV